MKRYISYLFLIMLAVSFSSCRGLVEYIREAQQRGKEQNESTYQVVFNEEEANARTSEKIKHKDNVTSDAVKSETHAAFEKKWNIHLDGNEDLVLLGEIDSWLGTPYKYGGTTKEGTDCSGMILSIYKKLYNIDTKRSAYELWQQSSIVKKDQLKSGDLVFFKINRRQVSHVGIYVANGYFVHASTSRGVVFDHLESKYFLERFEAGGRVGK